MRICCPPQQRRTRKPRKSRAAIGGAETHGFGDGHRLAAEVYDADLSGNGHKLVEIDVATGAQKPMRGPNWRNITDFTWLPDGSGILLSTQSHGENSAVRKWVLKVVFRSRLRAVAEARSIVARRWNSEQVPRRPKDGLCRDDQRRAPRRSTPGSAAQRKAAPAASASLHNKHGRFAYAGFLDQAPITPGEITTPFPASTSFCNWRARFAMSTSPGATILNFSIIGKID